MEVKCTGVVLCYSVNDYDRERPLYEFEFVSALPADDFEGLPGIAKLLIVSENIDAFKIGKNYSFAQEY